MPRTASASDSNTRPSPAPAIIRANVKAPTNSELMINPRRQSALDIDAILLQCMSPLRHGDMIRRRFPRSPEKYFGEVRLQRFGIGSLTAEADIAVGTDHIQTCA